MSSTATSRPRRDALDVEGYFDTGDLATIDNDGNVTICGRSKDLIKSGGEWINPAEIEDIVGRDPAVGLVAVIGRSDAKWGERPVLIVEPRRGQSPDAEALLRSLRGKVADWWIPDQVCGSNPCRWPRPVRLTKTGCAPTTQAGQF